MTWAGRDYCMKFLWAFVLPRFFRSTPVPSALYRCDIVIEGIQNMLREQYWVGVGGSKLFEQLLHKTRKMGAILHRISLWFLKIFGSRLRRSPDDYLLIFRCQTRQKMAVFACVVFVAPQFSGAFVGVQSFMPLVGAVGMAHLYFRHLYFRYLYFVTPTFLAPVFLTPFVFWHLYFWHLFINLYFWHLCSRHQLFWRDFWHPHFLHVHFAMDVNIRPVFANMSRCRFRQFRCQKYRRQICRCQKNTDVENIGVKVMCQKYRWQKYRWQTI